jgi:hypothetical protein
MREMILAVLNHARHTCAHRVADLLAICAACRADFTDGGKLRAVRDRPGEQ